MPVYRTPDGAALAYADEGEGPAVLLIHGWAAHGGFFSELSARLARSYRVVTPTLRAHAGSERGVEPLTVETLGEDIRNLVAALDLAPVAALGWSMGAMALWAADLPLQAFVVEEMGPKIVNDGAWRFGISGYSADQISETLAEITADWPAYVARLAPRMFSGATRARRPDLIDWARAEMAKADARAMADYWRSMAAQDFRATLSAVTAPVLALHGGDSQIYPAGATAFVADAAPRGASIVLPGVGHVPHLEAPDAFFEQVRNFLRRCHHETETLREGVDP